MNLLFLLTDQQRVDSLSCYGNDWIQTPHLNGLAEQSVVFDHTYVTQPVCSPARASLMTGLYPHTAGVPSCNVPLPSSSKTIAEHLAGSHRCAYYGKWHLGDEIFPQRGFDEWVGTEDSYRRFYSDEGRHRILSDYHHFLVKNGLTPDSASFGEPVFSRHFEASLDEPLTKASYLADRATEFIRNVGDDPFVLFVSYLEPHPPHTGPLNDLYDPQSLPVSPAFRAAPPENASLLNRVLSAYCSQSSEYGYDLRTDEGWRAVRARYWGNVTLVDRSVGRILQALTEAGLDDDTIVVFTSEHGEMAGDHGILGKCVLYEESVRVPLLVRSPDLKPGRTEGNISQVDLLPTLLDMMEQPIPEHLQGESRLDAARGEGTLRDNDVFIEWNGADGHPGQGEAEVNPEMAAPWRSVISADRWKLNLSPIDQCELYDLNSDPYEMTNRYDDPLQRDRVGDLTRRIQAWQGNTRDTVALPDP